MSVEIRVHIPIRTYSEANRRDHWSVKARRTKDQRTSTCFMVKMALGCGHRDEIKGASAIVVSLTRRGPRTMDCDNNQRAMKGIRDGIADALGIDDGDERIAWHYSQAKDSEYGVDISVEINEREGA